MMLMSIFIIQAMITTALLGLTFLTLRYGGRVLGWLLGRLYDWFIGDKNHVAPT